MVFIYMIIFTIVPWPSVAHLVMVSNLCQFPRPVFIDLCRHGNPWDRSQSSVESGLAVFHHRFTFIGAAILNFQVGAYTTHLNSTALSQSELSNFFTHIIRYVISYGQFQSRKSWQMFLKIAQCLLKATEFFVAKTCTIFSGTISI